MSAKIVAEEGVLKGVTLPLEGAETWVLGRDPDVSQIILEDPSVSRKHLMLRVSPEGIIAENLSETSPILINDAEVSEPQLLQSGDSIKIGDGYYRYLMEESEVMLTPEEPIVEEEVIEDERDTIFEEEEEQKEPLAEIDLDLSDSSPWLMKVVSGPNNGAQFSMYPDTSYVMGSDPGNCDIVFHDVSVSRQHARLTVSKDGSLTIEDLGSSNGTFIESKKIEERQTFSPNTLISLGTTSLIVYDREGERSTIVSPLLPEIVKILQQQDEEVEVEGVEEAPQVEEEVEEVAVPPESHQTIGSFFFVSIITGIFLVVGIATLFLFQAEEIEETPVNTKQVLENIVSESKYPSVRYSYNATTGRLFLVGHVINSVDRNQLIYSVTALPFVREVDNNVIVDELIWQEHNHVLAKNPDWRGVTIHSPAPGKFVISGYIQTREQANNLSDYLGQNFPYLELLERRIIVEETILNTTQVLLKDEGYNAVDVLISNGAVVLSGDVPFGEKENVGKIVAKIRKMEGVRDVRTYITELPAALSMIDLSDQYQVTGSLTQPSGETSVVIKGKILTVGDSLDGRTIKSIKSGVIMLESGGIKYRIDFNQ
ncbi:MAG: hypothetical protein K940chlam3_00845 [Chlamydiae bacterium]|nr:hypothetical protein [Chlamydiota bacterium]